MTQQPLHVVIIGGGLSGLCLAQGLKKAEISVAVYERDRTPSERLQGYRISINAQGSRALFQCLPPQLYETLPAGLSHSKNRAMAREESLDGLINMRIEKACLTSNILVQLFRMGTPWS